MLRVSSGFQTLENNKTTRLAALWFQKFPAFGNLMKPSHSFLKYSVLRRIFTHLWFLSKVCLYPHHSSFMMPAWGLLQWKMARKTLKKRKVPFLQSYLSSPRQLIEFNGSNSPLLEVKHELPQGSLLSSRLSSSRHHLHEKL